MNSTPATASLTDRIIAGVSLLVTVVAFAYNGFLLHCIFEGKRLIEAVELAAGRELSGYELFSEHREVSGYFYPDRALQGDTLYWSSAISLPWVMALWIAASLGGLVILLRLFRHKQRIRATGWCALAAMICLLVAVISQVSLMKKIAWALD